MQREYAKLIEADFDWMTATSSDEYVWHDWLLAFTAVRACEEGKGNSTKNARLLGYEGQQVGKVFIGHRKDGYMVRTTSEAAGKYMQWFYDAGRRVTRLDIQSTWEFAQPDEARLDKIYQDCLGAKSKTGRPISVSRIQRRLRTETVYIGSRASVAFFRIYDKGLEEGTADAGKLLRWEAEYKDELATSLAGQLVPEPNLESAIVATIGLEMQNRHLPYPTPDTHLAASVGLRRATSEVETSMAWLSGPVATTVARCVNELGIERVARALFRKVVESNTDTDSVLTILYDLVS